MAIFRLRKSTGGSTLRGGDALRVGTVAKSTSGTINAGGSVSAAVHKDGETTATLNAGGSVVAAIAKAVERTGTLNGGGGFAATASQNKSTSGTVRSGGSLTPSVEGAHETSGTINNGGGLSTVVTHDGSTSGVLNGGGSFSATASQDKQVAVTLNGGGSITPTVDGDHTFRSDFTDLFTGTSGPWDSSIWSDAYVSDDGAVDLVANEGRLTTGTLGTKTVRIESKHAHAEVHDLLFKWTILEESSTNASLYVVLRHDGNWIADIHGELVNPLNGYTISLNPNVNYMQVRSWVDGESTVLNQGNITLLDNTPYWFRFKVEGHTIYRRQWEVGDDEPSWWSTSVDAAQSHDAGTLALVAWTDNGTFVNHIDDLSLHAGASGGGSLASTALHDGSIAATANAGGSFTTTAVSSRTKSETVHAGGNLTAVASSSTASYVELELADLQDPEVDTGHIVHVRGYAVSGTQPVDVDLYQGTTLIDSWDNESFSTSTTTHELNVGATEAATISNYQDLRLRIEMDATATDVVRIVDVWLEVPEPPPASTTANLNGGGSFAETLNHHGLVPAFPALDEGLMGPIAFDGGPSIAATAAGRIPGTAAAELHGGASATVTVSSDRDTSASLNAGGSVSASWSYKRSVAVSMNGGARIRYSSNVRITFVELNTGPMIHALASPWYDIGTSIGIGETDDGAGVGITDDGAGFGSTSSNTPFGNVGKIRVTGRTS